MLNTINNRIRILPKHLINQIAAGEVVERPASIIKELVENSIDANATKIDIKIINGGKNLISITDNGNGMIEDDLRLCLHPHATSKLLDDTLVQIHSLGFRGEALASIASIAKIEIESKHRKSSQGFVIKCKGGQTEDLAPSSFPFSGTKISVFDIFFNTPARLKFLRSTNTETLFCYKTFKRLALAKPDIHFTLESNGKVVFNYSSIVSTKEHQIKKRVHDILGKYFIENSIYIDYSNSMFNLYGLINKPTFNKNTTDDQFIIVNGRPLKDRFLTGIIKAAYSDVLFSGRHAIFALYMDIDPQEIDVNINPTKSEIKFKDPSFIRHIIFRTIKESLGKIELQNNNKTIGDNILNLAESNVTPPVQTEINTHATNLKTTNLPLSENFYTPNIHDSEKTKDVAVLPHSEGYPPLGYAKAQLHKNWIIAQNKEGIILVDQHAAHERITHEKIKRQYLNHNIKLQQLLTPAIIYLSPTQMLISQEYIDEINKLGIKCNIFGENHVQITEYPAILKNPNIEKLFYDILSSLEKIEHPQNFYKYLNNTIASLACHNSIRASQELSIAEMNALLRSLENTPNYAQCSHGRPTFVQLSIKSIEGLFGR